MKRAVAKMGYEVREQHLNYKVTNNKYVWEY